MVDNKGKIKVSNPSKRKLNPNVQSLQSELGYRDGSPFSNKPWLDIHTPNGMIDMSDTGIPILANGQYLPPYSGMHQFDTNNVTEIPIKAEGGWLDNYRDGGQPDVMDRLGRLHSKNSGYIPKAQKGGGKWDFSSMNTTPQVPLPPPF